MRNSMMMFTFFMSTRNTFLAKFGPKNQNHQFELKFLTRLIWICRIQWWCSLFQFIGNTFLGMFGPKNQNCQFELKFCTRIIWIYRVQWWCSLFQFLNGNTRNTRFRLSGQSGHKNEICQFKLKFGTKTNVNMQNSMVMVTVSLFDHKCLFWENLVQKFKIVQSEIWYKD